MVWNLVRERNVRSDRNTYGVRQDWRRSRRRRGRRWRWRRFKSLLGGARAEAAGGRGRVVRPGVTEGAGGALGEAESVARDVVAHLQRQPFAGRPASGAALASPSGATESSATPKGLAESGAPRRSFVGQPGGAGNGGTDLALGRDRNLLKSRRQRRDIHAGLGRPLRPCRLQRDFGNSHLLSPLPLLAAPLGPGREAGHGALGARHSGQGRACDLALLKKKKNVTVKGPTGRKLLSRS